MRFSKICVQHFSRRNSLVPSRISGRKPSLRHAKRKGRAEPEFATNIDAPSVCLKAPAMRKVSIGGAFYFIFSLSFAVNVSNIPVNFV
uniref:Uncharacterized protein n=1 Tax=Ascaris lumbricoides TaxID=6252 RepID=A0A0M3HL77_ASCLU